MTYKCKRIKKVWDESNRQGRFLYLVIIYGLTSLEEGIWMNVSYLMKGHG